MGLTALVFPASISIGSGEILSAAFRSNRRAPSVLASSNLRALGTFTGLYVLRSRLFVLTCSKRIDATATGRKTTRQCRRAWETGLPELFAFRSAQLLFCHRHDHRSNGSLLSFASQVLRGSPAASIDIAFP
jgi:hypothetical protein